MPAADHAQIALSAVESCSAKPTSNGYLTGDGVVPTPGYSCPLKLAVGWAIPRRLLAYTTVTNLDTHEPEGIESVLPAERRSVEMIAGGASLSDILNDISDAVHPQDPEISSSTRVLAMKRTSMLTMAMIPVLLACTERDTSPDTASVPDTGKYAVKVPGGLAFSEFKGYEGWHLISISSGGPVLAATLGNPEMIAAYQNGHPGNGKPWPDGAKMAKIHWISKDLETLAGAKVPARQHDVDFMVKDSKRFKDSAGWGWAAFLYDTASGTFTPATTASKPPQANDAKCGLGCHTIVASRDYVFTEYGQR